MGMAVVVNLLLLPCTRMGKQRIVITQGIHYPSDAFFLSLMLLLLLHPPHGLLRDYKTFHAFLNVQVKRNIFNQTLKSVL